MKTEELTDIALKAGEILLGSGAEIYRVEDTIKRICRSYNADCESFVLPTGIFISINGSGYEAVSSMKRITERTVDLHKIEQVNSFSRSLQENPVDYAIALEILEDIYKSRKFSFPVRLLTAGAASFVFTMLFRGNAGEAVAALLISMIIFFIEEKISEIGFFQFFEFFAAGMIAAAASIVAVIIYPQLNIYRIIIGAVVIFLPGVAITNGIKDALYGDIVSSLARLGEAIFVAAAIGAGVGITLSIGLRWV